MTHSNSRVFLVGHMLCAFLASRLTTVSLDIMCANTEVVSDRERKWREVCGAWRWLHHRVLYLVSSVFVQYVSSDAA